MLSFKIESAPYQKWYGAERNSKMKNLDIVAKESKGTTFRNPLPIYYDYTTDEVLTDKLIAAQGNTNYFKCTELIRENTEREIEAAVWRALSM